MGVVGVREMAPDGDRVQVKVTGSGLEEVGDGLGWWEAMSW